MDHVIKDAEGKEVMRFNEDGEIAVARYPKLSPKLRKYIIDVYVDVTGEKAEKIESFLNYDDEIKEGQFCS